MGAVKKRFGMATLFLAVGLVLFAVGCGSDSVSTPDTTPTSPSIAAPAPNATPSAPAPSTTGFVPPADPSELDGQGAETRSCVNNNRIVLSYWNRTNFCKSTVPFTEIIRGGPRPNGIPAIYDPRFEDASVDWIGENDPVIALEIGGAARAYPLAILIGHEIVNDNFGDVPVAVTFCPLCNAAVVFDRRVGDATLAFGTTGNLRNSDLVMFDDLTESWWQQFTGNAIVGDFAGQKLTTIPALVVGWSDFKERYPNGQVLQRPANRIYINPYFGYDTNESPFLYIGPRDNVLSAVERVVTVRISEQSAAYPFTVLENQPVVNDEVGGTPIAVFWKTGTNSALDNRDISRGRDVGSSAVYLREHNGMVLEFENAGGTIRDKQTASSWNIFGQATAGELEGAQLEIVDSQEHFWFAQYAFYPDTRIFMLPDA